MRTISSVLVVSVVSLVTFSVACSKDPPPPQNPAGVTQPYGQPGMQPGMQQPGMQPGMQQPGMQPGMQPGAQPQPTGPVAGQMATPGPTALACQNDSQCMTHRCNTQFGKCAFPCQSDADCIQGASCFVAAGPAAACLPKPPGAP
jgi:hypothetical protein